MKQYKQHFLDKLAEESLDLSTTEKTLADYITNNYKKISFLDLSDVSKILSLDTDLINSYCNKLGFKDYEELRKSIRDLAMSELSSTDRFEFSQINMNSKIASVKNTVIIKELSNLNKLMESFDESLFYTMLEEIINAPEIIVVATRSSAIIADYIEHMFNKIGKRTTKITSGASSNFDNFAMFDKNALVLAIGFARYPKETIRVLSFFKKHSFKVISITDNTLSALAPFSDLVFPIPCESVSITDFYATPISLINMMIILLSQIDKEGSLSYLNKFEEIAKEYGFYF